MKKYLYLLVAIVCMGFAACSSDDDGGVLDGKWACSAEGYVLRPGDVLTIAGNKFSLYISRGNYRADFHGTEEGTCSFDTEKNQVTFTPTHFYDYEMKEIDYDGYGALDSYTYIIEGNKLTLTDVRSSYQEYFTRQ